MIFFCFVLFLIQNKQSNQVDSVSVQVRGVVAMYNSAESGTSSQGKSYGGGISIFFNENQHDNPGATVTNCSVSANTAAACQNVFAEFMCT